MLECRGWRIGLHGHSSSPSGPAIAPTARRRWDVWDADTARLLGGVFEPVASPIAWWHRYVGMLPWPTRWLFCEEPDGSLVFTLSFHWGRRRASVYDALQRYLGQIRLARDRTASLILAYPQPSWQIIRSTAEGWSVDVPCSRSGSVTGHARWLEAVPSAELRYSGQLWLPPECDDQPFVKMVLLAAAVFLAYHRAPAAILIACSGVLPC
ncbi:MAG: hypothetical protein NZ703_10645 [Gemmataceae bacterium]|nr:hypothetical protein [Gemmataceae bacterium]